MSCVPGEIFWRCRRGVRELDLLLYTFIESHYSLLSVKEKAQFEKLLAYSDPELMAWLCAGEPGPTELQVLLDMIRLSE